MCKVVVVVAVSVAVLAVIVYATENKGTKKKGVSLANVMETNQEGEGDDGTNGRDIRWEREVESSRGNKQKKKQQQDLMSKILPMMIVPFMIQTAMIPMVLTSLKFMLIKSAFIGKLAIILVALNFLRRSMNPGGVYSHNVNIQPANEMLMQEHYGYNGGTEYGAYTNGRKIR